MRDSVRTTASTTSLSTSPRTPPWPYKKWPWFMGPPPKGLNCEHGDPRKCRMGRFRRQVENMKKISFLDFNLLVPQNVQMGKFPVPDFCCEKVEKFCGLKNDFDFFKPIVPKYNETVKVINSTWNETQTPVSDFEFETNFEPEIVKNNIFVRGCDPGLSDVLSAIGSKATFTFLTSISVITFFLSFLFGILSCFCQPKPEKPSFVNYGRQKVPVSRRL